MRHKRVEHRRCVVNRRVRARTPRLGELPLDSLQMLKSLLNLLFADLAERHLIRVNLQLLEDLGHLLLVRDELHDTLDGRVEGRVGDGAGGCGGGSSGRAGAGG